MLVEFLNNFKSVVLSTIDDNNLPYTSYAPFIKKDGLYYVYLSSMAKHTRNLDNKKEVSLFFIEDEISCDNIFGRKRVVLQCVSNKLKRDNKEFEELIKIFEETHGTTMKMLKTMTDFSIYSFTPLSGEAVFGFGEAYDIGGENCDKLCDRKGQKGHSK